MDILRQIAEIGTLGPHITTFILGFTIFLLYLWSSSRNHDYWKKKGVPYAKGYPFFGSILENLRKPFQDTELDRYKKYGRIYGHFEGIRPLLSVADPEVLRNILVKDFHAFTGRRSFATGEKITENILSRLQGETWKRVRTIVTPTFSTGKIKRMLGIFKECSRTLVKNFKESAEKGQPVDAKRVYGAFAMDVIASSSFSTKIDSHNDPNNKFVATARDVFTRKFSWRVILFALLPRLMRLFKFTVFSPKGLKFFSDVTMQIIEERRKTGQTRNDFLQLLMDTAKEGYDESKSDLKETENDITANYGDESDVVFRNIVSKKSLSQNELIAQCVIFFLAGYDTTSSTLAFTTYLLALNPDTQEKLIQEVDDVLKDNNGELTYEAVQSMKYLDNIISETLRMYPPAVRLERKADMDYKLGNTGIVIPKGMLITVPSYAMHRDPEFFPEPEKFKPDRFTPEEKGKRNPYTYTPFGIGPRNCIGMRFALMEIKVCLAHVISNFRIKKCSQTKIPLDFETGQGLISPKSIIVQLEVRKDAVKTL